MVQQIEFWRERVDREEEQLKEIRSEIGLSLTYQLDVLMKLYEESKGHQPRQQLLDYCEKAIMADPT